ncbi:MAG TPA: 30S ribosomal protein S20 [Tepidisphaeraceae bacterium]
MAHSLSAKKRIRQTLKRRARNRARKDAIKTEIKTFMSAVNGGDAKKAETQFRTVAKRLDQIAAKGTIHKNTAARRRSRLAKRLNAMRNAPKSTAGAGTKAAKA